MNSNIVRDSAPSALRSLNVRISFRALLLRLLAACALGGFWLSAHSASVTKSGPSVQHGPNSATVGYPGGLAREILGRRDYTPVADGVSVVDNVPLKIAGEVIGVAVARKVLTTVIPGIAAAATVITVGSALHDYYQAANVQRTSSGGYTTNQGASAQFTYGYKKGGMDEWYSSLDALIAAYRSSAIQSIQGQTGQSGLAYSRHTVVETDPGTYKVTTWAQKNGGELSQVDIQYFYKVTKSGCYGEDGKWVGNTTGGLCPGGTPVAITKEQAVTKLTNAPIPNPGAVVREAVEAGVPADAGPVSVTGPATSPTPSVQTSTGPSGSTTSTTTNNYQYDGDTVTYTTTTTINVTNNAGDIVSTTTSTDTKPEDERSECEKAPDSLGCAELDTPEGEISKETKNVSFQEESLFGTGSCPANATMSFGSIGGKSATVVDWSTFCNYALPVRGLVMALAAITGFFIILPGSNQA